MKKFWSILILLLIATTTLPQSSFALAIFGTGSVGSFTGDISYSASNAELSVTLTNTTSAGSGVFITAFAFNNPDDLISGVTLTTTDPDFGVIGGPTFDNSIQATPLGFFDIGASTSPTAVQPYLGSGIPSLGIAPGVTATFTFGFSGTGLSSLTETSFVNELTSSGAFLGVRFRGTDSDNISANVGVAPEPSTVLSLGAGLLLLAGLIRFRRRQT